jgi:hypothetical protein
VNFFFLSATLKFLFKTNDLVDEPQRLPTMKSPHYAAIFGTLALFGCLVIVVSTAYVHRVSTRVSSDECEWDGEETDEETLVEEYRE